MLHVGSGRASDEFLTESDGKNANCNLHVMNLWCHTDMQCCNVDMACKCNDILIMRTLTTYIHTHTVVIRNQIEAPNLQHQCKMPHSLHHVHLLVLHVLLVSGPRSSSGRQLPTDASYKSPQSCWGQVEKKTADTYCMHTLQSPC